MSDCVIVDASFAVKWVVDELGTPEATALRRDWLAAGVRIVAPRLILYETASALLNKARFEGMTIDEAVVAMDSFLETGIELQDSPQTHARAIQISEEIRHGSVYDPHYLALAEIFDCEVWTADRPFYNRARLRGHSIRLLA